MADSGREPRSRAGQAASPGPIGLRLALAFLAVALAAVALLACLTAAFAAADVSQLASRQRAELTKAISVAAGAAWERTDSWANGDLSPVLDLATRTGADAQIRDLAGLPVASTPGFAARSASPQSTATVTVGARRVGEATVRFSSTGLGAPTTLCRSRCCAP